MKKVLLFGVLMIVVTLSGCDFFGGDDVPVDVDDELTCTEDPMQEKCSDITVIDCELTPDDQSCLPEEAYAETYELLSIENAEVDSFAEVVSKYQSLNEFFESNYFIYSIDETELQDEVNQNNGLTRLQFLNYHEGQQEFKNVIDSSVLHMLELVINNISSNEVVFEEGSDFSYYYFGSEVIGSLIMNDNGFRLSYKMLNTDDYGVQYVAFSHDIKLFKTDDDRVVSEVIKTSYYQENREQSYYLYDSEIGSISKDIVITNNSLSYKSVVVDVVNETSEGVLFYLGETDVIEHSYYSYEEQRSFTKAFEIDQFGNLTKAFELSLYDGYNMVVSASAYDLDAEQISFDLKINIAYIDNWIRMNNYELFDGDNLQVMNYTSLRNDYTTEFSGAIEFYGLPALDDYFINDMLYSIDYHFKNNNFLHESFVDLVNEEINLDTTGSGIVIDEIRFDVSTELEQLFVFGVDGVVQNRIMEVSSEFDFGFDVDNLPGVIDCDETPVNNLCPFKVDINDVTFDDDEFVPDNDVVEDVDDYIVDLYYAYDHIRGLPIYQMDLGIYFMLDYRTFQEYSSSDTGLELDSHTFTPEKIVEGNQIRYDIGDLFNQQFHYHDYVKEVRDLTSCENFVEDQVFSCEDNVFHKFIHNEDMIYLQTRAYFGEENYSGQQTIGYETSIVLIEYINQVPRYTFFNYTNTNGESEHINYALYDENNMFTSYELSIREYGSNIKISKFDLMNNEAEVLSIQGGSGYSYFEYNYYSEEDQIVYNFYGNDTSSNVELSLYDENRFQVGIETSISDYEDAYTAFIHGVEAVDGWDQILGYDMYNDGTLLEFSNVQGIDYQLNNSTKGIVIRTFVHPSLNQSTFLHPTDVLTNNFITYDEFMSIYDSMPNSYDDIYVGSRIFEINGVTYDLSTMDYSQGDIVIPVWLIEQAQDTESLFIID